LRQSITITGLGSELFDAASENISDIYAIFSRNFPPQKLLPWMSTHFNEHITITASNRLFTPQKDAPNQSAISIGHNLDPTGRLTEMAGREYFHGEENRVQIWERTKNRTSL
jgi:hypothetical protein